MQTTSGLGRKFKLILTLHDLIYYRHRTPPRDFNWLIRLGWWLFHLTYWPQRFLLNGADAVATVSETSKNQILRHKLTRRPVTVIHNAAEPAESSDTKSRHDSKHLVYMGSFIGYKNVETLVRGMHYLPDHTLVLLSRASAEVRMQLELLATEVGAKIEFAQGVTDEQYHQWLISAKALVTASLDEGFGLPLVEAMERGCPIVVSNLEIFQEVGGEAALFFEATNPKDFADQVLKLENEQFWLEKSKLSLLQSKHFSWERSAQELISLAKSLGA
jgi:glycosyltransferase involved in cell wall biosynthesis